MDCASGSGFRALIVLSRTTGSEGEGEALVEARGPGARSTKPGGAGSKRFALTRAWNVSSLPPFSWLRAGRGMYLHRARIRVQQRASGEGQVDDELMEGQQQRA